MVFRHPLVPQVQLKTEKVYKFSDEASICGNCNLPVSKCSYRCKRYKEEYEKLRQGSISGNTDGKSD